MKNDVKNATVKKKVVAVEKVLTAMRKRKAEGAQANVTVDTFE